jgi:DNA polymerase-3 subunit delta
MNIYLICGSYYHLINKEIKKIVKSNETINIYYDNMLSLLEKASYFSFDNSSKYYVIKNCPIFSGAKNEENEELLLKYMKKENPNSVLLFIVDTYDNRKKIVKTIKDNGKIIDTGKIDYKNIYTYINDYLKFYNYTIEYKATNYMVNTYGLNIDLIFNELDKVMIYYSKPSLIKESDLKKIVSNPLDTNVFHFIDACICKRKKEILNLYHDLKIVKVEDTMLIIMLAKEYRQMYIIKKDSQDNKNISEMMKDTSLQEWQVRKLYNESQNYSEKELLSSIKKLALIDERLKTGKINKETALTNYFMDLFVS